MSSCKIQATNDEENWIDITSESSGIISGGIRTVVFEFEEEIKYKKYRVLILAGGVSNLVSQGISEFKLYGF